MNSTIGFETFSKIKIIIRLILRYKLRPAPPPLKHHGGTKVVLNVFLVSNVIGDVVFHADW